MATQLLAPDHSSVQSRAKPAVNLLSHLKLTSSSRLAEHHLRVGHLSEALAIRLGMDPAAAAQVGQAGALHDIGMALVPEEMVDHAGLLNPGEKELVHRHSLWGSELLELSEDPTLRLAARVALQHHERWNGTGYPSGLAGEEICLEARIVAVCAIYDALRHPRPGKVPLTEADALTVLRDGDAEMQPGGFDPYVLDVFAGMLAEGDGVQMLPDCDQPTLKAAGTSVQPPSICRESGEDADKMTVRHRIAIVDDDDAVRRSTAGLFRGAGHMVASFTTGAEFLASDLPADLSCILLDMRMPGLDGLGVMRVLRERGNTPPIVVLSGHGDVPMAVEAMRLGAVNFLEKPYPPKKLAEVVARACATSTRRAHAPTGLRARRAIAALTERQREVLRGVLKGQSNKIIADELGLSIRTIETYRAQMLDKLGLRGTAEVVKLAIAAGLDD